MLVAYMTRWQSREADRFKIHGGEGVEESIATLCCGDMRVMLQASPRGDDTAIGTWTLPPWYWRLKQTKRVAVACWSCFLMTCTFPKVVILYQWGKTYIIQQKMLSQVQTIWEQNMIRTIPRIILQNEFQVIKSHI